MQSHCWAYTFTHILHTNLIIHLDWEMLILILKYVFVTKKSWVCIFQKSDILMKEKEYFEMILKWISKQKAPACRELLKVLCSTEKAMGSFLSLCGPVWMDPSPFLFYPFNLCWHSCLELSHIASSMIHQFFFLIWPWLRWKSSVYPSNYCLFQIIGKVIILSTAFFSRQWVLNVRTF